MSSLLGATTWAILGPMRNGPSSKVVGFGTNRKRVLASVSGVPLTIFFNNYANIIYKMTKKLIGPRLLLMTNLSHTRVKLSEGDEHVDIVKFDWSRGRKSTAQAS